MNLSLLRCHSFNRQGRTLFHSRLFFPREVRHDMQVVCRFARTAAGHLDRGLSGPEELAAFKKRYETERRGHSTGDRIVAAFCELEHRRGFRYSWTDALLHSVELEFDNSVYYTIDETLEYLYGAADVIGLYIAAVFRLPPETQRPAQMLGRAMEYLGLIRDLEEHNSFGRCYLPIGETTLANLEYSTVMEDAPEFMRYLNKQLDRYHEWHREAEGLYRLIPRRSLVPIKTAADMHAWTARHIELNPFVVYERKLEPSSVRVAWTAVGNMLRPAGRLDREAQAAQH